MQKLTRREALVGTAAVAAATVLPVPKAIPVDVIFNVEVATTYTLDDLGAAWGLTRFGCSFAENDLESDASFRERIYTKAGELESFLTLSKCNA